MKVIYSKNISIGTEDKEGHGMVQPSCSCDERGNASENKRNVSQNDNIDRDLQLDRWMENIKAFIRSIDINQL